jgi:hypothetical protein
MSYQKLTPDNLNTSQSILKLDKYNGRVNIIDFENPNIMFQMQERIALKNKSTSYSEALSGNYEYNVLGQVYFSDKNIQIIQNGLRAGVYNKSNHQFIIPPQNIDNLKIIMRSMYLQYAQHLENNITQQVERLNKLVLDYCIPVVYKEAVGYLKYTQDQSSLVVPMERPLNHDRAYKQLELKQYI